MIQHLSFSSLALWTNNPLAWHKKYVLGIKDQKTNPAALEGVATHDYIKNILKGHGKEVALQSATRIIDQTDNVEWGKTGSIEKSKENLTKFISAWEEDYSGLPGRLVHCEEYFSDRITGIKVPLLGYVDAVVEDDKQTLVVIDWKTVRSYEDQLKPAHIVQACFYKWLLERKYGKRISRAEFVQIKASKNEDGSPRVRTLVLTFADHPEYERAVKRLVKESLKMILKKNPSMLPNLRDDYDGQSSWESFVQNS